MSHLIEFILQLFGEIAHHYGFWRFFLCLMAGISIASVVWWKLAEGSTTNVIAAGAIVTLSAIGVFWERSVD